MFLEYFKTAGLAVVQIFVLGALGYILMRKNILGEAGLDILSRLVVEVTLPVMIFCQLIRDFRFNIYPQWWIFPLISLVVTVLGLAVGYILSVFIKGGEHKAQFLSLVTFQNSGYLPLALIAALLPGSQKDTMFIYIFLFLLGFNLVMWSFGVYMLSFHKSRKFELGSLFSPAVIAIILSLVIVFLGLNSFIPSALLKPMSMVGDCTLPLAMMVVGGSLSLLRIRHTDNKAMLLLVLAKLLILPALGLWFLSRVSLPPLIGLLIIMQLAVPPATSLSVIVRHYKKEDLLISQGIFFGHIIGLVSLPLFLSLYFMLAVIK
ncbi:MAG: AEC family transporter [Candidatus Omnitrophota bacterium]